MIFDNNYHYNAMPIRLLVNIQDADSAGIQTASENNNGTRMGYNHPMEKNTLSARAPSPWLPLLLAIAIFMQMLDATILNTALPEIAADLNESPPDMQQAVVAYTLTVALLIPLSSYLADKFGTKKVFFGSIAVFMLGSALCAASGSLFELTLSRVVQGIGGSMLVPIPRLTILRVYEKSKLLNAINYAVMPALIGPALDLWRAVIWSNTLRGTGFSCSTCPSVCWVSYWDATSCPMSKATIPLWISKAI